MDKGMGMQRNSWSEILKGRGHLGDLGVDGKIILIWLLNKYGVRMWTEFNWIWIRSSDRLSEHSNFSHKRRGIS